MFLSEKLAGFTELLENKILKLKKYRTKPNANRAIIKAQELFLYDVIQFHNTVQSLGCLELWEGINKQMRTLKAQDPKIDGFRIELFSGDGPKHQALIRIQTSL